MTSLTMSHITEQLLNINRRIETATANANRKSGEVKLVAVSKTFSNEDILSAYHAGQRRFGENKVQELEMKAKSLPPDIEWHFIGHMQSNKVLRAIQFASYIHSVDSIKLIERIERLSAECGKTPKILIEANISGEKTKFGAESTQQITDMVQAAAQMHNLRCVGLMTMAPYQASDNELFNIFSSLRQLRCDIEQQLKVELPELSMGMSDDFPVAIANGATFVRIGSAIFGKRAVNNN